ncbi:hypothetical protein ABGB16_20965 [Micromonospora sp. B11E3]|uniref:hypothetical protein n=1 Tax=Micromonospora sp. B11E3 TaxID=3153562 RepID=UPI00325F8D13
MSAEVITFNGDALAQRVGLLGDFRDELVGTIDVVKLLAEGRWAGDDEQSQQFRAFVMHLLGDIVLGVFVQLGNGAGFQGEKLGVYHQVGENTEETVNDLVPEISGGYRG